MRVGAHARIEMRRIRTAQNRLTSVGAAGDGAGAAREEEKVGLLDVEAQEPDGKAEKWPPGQRPLAALQYGADGESCLGRALRRCGACCCGEATPRAVLRGALLMLFGALLGALYHVSSSGAEGGVHPLELDPSMRDAVTVLVNAFGSDRAPQLLHTVAHFASCEMVAEVVVTHSGPRNEALEREMAAAAHRAPVRIVNHAGASFNNRFLPVDGLATDAVFLVDDDITIPCHDMRPALEAWRVNENLLVGYTARLHTVEPAGGDAMPELVAQPGAAPAEAERVGEEAQRLAAQGLRASDGSRYRYNGWWRVGWESRYSIVLPTKGALLHRSWLRRYSEEMPAAVRYFVDKQRQCEDLAMSFFVAKETSRAPLLVRGSVVDLGKFSGVSTSKKQAGSALSGGTKHFGSRSDCLNALATLFGGMPLHESRIIVGSTHSALFNRPGNVWEMVSADMFI